MSDEPDRYFDQQDAAIKVILVEKRGDELTDILVGALHEAARLLREESDLETVH